MDKGDEPYITPYDEDAAERARRFCRTRGLTKDDVKIVRSGDNVKVVVIKNGAKCNI